jgi:hypothetical protein
MAVDTAKPWDTFDQELQPDGVSTIFTSGQRPKVTLRPVISTYRYQRNTGAPVEKFILVDLTDTTVQPGNLTSNAGDKRGFFTERVTVKVHLEDDGAFAIRKDAPPTTAQGGSSSSSLSYSLSVGAFGDTGTFNAGGTISSGVSQSLPDFEIINVTDSSAKLMEHRYGLRLVDGAVYRGPLDLVDTNATGGRVRGLNPRATSNLPLQSSVLFHSAQPASGKRRVTVEITHRLMMVEKTYQAMQTVPSSNRFDMSPDAGRQTHYVPYAFGRIEIDTTPNVTVYPWKFDVDLDTGKIAHVL